MAKRNVSKKATKTTVGDKKAKCNSSSGSKTLSKINAEELLGKVRTKGGWGEALVTRRELHDIEPSAASVLARHKGGLTLDGLTHLSDASAVRLAKHKGHAISLDGLKTLSDNAAEAFANYNGDQLSLGGLVSITELAAKSLGQFHGSLILNGLTTLSPEIAEALAKNNKTLSLGGVTEFSEATAKSFAKFNGSSLDFNGISCMADDVAYALSPVANRVSLSGLTEISDEAAMSLLEVESIIALKQSLWDQMNLETISFDSITRVLTSDVVNKYVRGHRLNPAAMLGMRIVGGPMVVRLRDFRSLDENAAKVVAGCSGTLLLDGVVSMPENVACKLASHNGVLSLTGLREISDSAAVSLVRHNGELRLKLSELPHSAASILSEHQSILEKRQDSLSNGLCPECGNTLATVLAKQCLACGAAWH